jgi:prophage regulatory protein
MASPEVTGKKTGRRLLDYQALRARGIPWTRVHLARLEAAGKFPMHIDVGENSSAWFEDEIDDFLETKAAERDAKAQALVEVTATGHEMSAQPSPKEVADQQKVIRNLSARVRKARKAKKAQQPNSQLPNSE